MFNELILISIFLVVHFFLEKNKMKIFGSYFLDIPNLKRKIHKKPTYLIGGHFIFFSYLLFLIFSFNNDFNEKIMLLFIYLSVFLIGILDDLRDLKPTTKLSLILLIYLILIYFDKDYLLSRIYLETFEKYLNFGPYSILVSSLCILLLVNAINLIDGINGLAIMIFIIIFTFLYFFLKVDFNVYLLILFLFIFFNIYKGQYFLGNSGSLIIGALIGFSTIKAYNLNFIEKNSAEDIFILFLIPGIDMLRLFIQRILNKKNPFSADKMHLHHLLINKFSLPKVLFIYFSFITISSYVAFNNYLPESITIFGILTIYFFSVIFLIKSKTKLK